MAKSMVPSVIPRAFSPIPFLLAQRGPLPINPNIAPQIALLRPDIFGPGIGAYLPIGHLARQFTFQILIKKRMARRSTNIENSQSSHRNGCTACHSNRMRMKKPPKGGWIDGTTVRSPPAIHPIPKRDW